MTLSKEAMTAAKEIIELIKRAQAANAPVLTVDIAGIIDRNLANR